MDKIKILLKEKKTQLARKQRLIEEYLDIKNSIDGFENNIKAEVEYTRLATEIRFLIEFIDDLEYCLLDCEKEVSVVKEETQEFDFPSLEASKQNNCNPEYEKKKQETHRLIAYFEDNICKLEKVTSIKFVCELSKNGNKLVEEAIKKCIGNNIHSYKGFESIVNEK